MSGDDVVVRARAIVLESAKVEADVNERGPLPELFATFERVARRVAPASDADACRGRTHPSAGCRVRELHQGAARGNAGTAVNYLDAALKADPAFDRARIALWEVYDEQGEHARALAAVNGVKPDSPLAQAGAVSAGRFRR